MLYRLIPCLSQGIFSPSCDLMLFQMTWHYIISCQLMSPYLSRVFSCGFIALPPRCVMTLGPSIFGVRRHFLCRIETKGETMKTSSCAGCHPGLVSIARCLAIRFADLISITVFSSSTKGCQIAIVKVKANHGFRCNHSIAIVSA